MSSEDDTAKKLPEVAPVRKPAHVAFKSSFGPQNLVKEDVNKAVNKVMPQMKTYDGAKNAFQTKVLNEALLGELTVGKNIE